MSKRYEKPDDDDGRRWYTPQSVFYKGRTPATRLRCFEQMSEEQAERRHRETERQLREGAGR